MGRRILIAGAALLLVFIGLVPRAFTTIAQGDTYVLSDFDIVYPYDDPRQDIPPSDRAAEVSFSTRWPQSGYPGEAQCELTLSDAQGLVVGTLTFDLISATNGSRAVPMVVPVSGVPVSAEASCHDLFDNTSSRGYVVTGPTRASAVADSSPGSDSPNRTQLTFQVTWQETGSEPDFRTCRLMVKRVDGTLDPPTRFNLLSGDGEVTLVIEGSPASVADANVTCGPFEAE